MGIVNLVLVLFLTDECELQPEKEVYTELTQDDSTNDTDIDAGNFEESSEVTPTPQASRNWIIRIFRWLSDQLAQISPSTRSVMYKLWFLLAVDSLADGMVPYSLTNYYMDEKFHPAKSTLGDITSFSYFMGAISAAFAGPLARKIGLINTMVFTHTPSSAAVLLFPFPPYLWMTAGLLLIRAGLNNMDQAPRAAFIAAVVKPEERTAVMGITSTVRTLAATAGPTVTGMLASSDRFWIAFIVAGSCRLSYDFGLYAMFVNMKLHTHEKPVDLSNQHGPRRVPDEEMELESLADTDSGSEETRSEKSEPETATLQVPDSSNQRIRSRSPRRAEI